MTGKNKPSDKVRFIKPPNVLKQKVGTGGITQERLEKSQKLIDTVKIDFAPYAQTFLKQMAAEAKKAHKSNDNFQETKDKLIGPVMQLKANGGMFRYQLVSDVADIALQFLEDVEEINDDALAVIKAHENAIKIIVSNKLTGDGGKEGYALVKELHNASKRYFAKYKK